MAIFHLSTKVLERTKGRSAVAAAAYRAGETLIDARRGNEHDFSRKNGVLYSQVILPGGGEMDRLQLWNSVEFHHKRGDAVTAREFEFSIASELNENQRLELGIKFAKEISDKYGVAADIAFHAPRNLMKKEIEELNGEFKHIDPKTKKPTNGNFHAHVLVSACYADENGNLGKKCVELDPIHCQRKKIENSTEWARRRWNELLNDALEKTGHSDRVDHRSHKARGITNEPGQHLGPAGAGRIRNGKTSKRGQDLKTDKSKATEIEDLARQITELEEESKREKQDMVSRTRDIFQRSRKAAAAAAAAPQKSEPDAEKNASETVFARLVINGSQPGQPAAQPSNFKRWQAKNGDIVYLFKTEDKHGRKAAFSERKNTIRVYAPDDGNTLAASIKLAAEKFPNGVTLSGSDEFRRAAEAEAARIGLPVSNPLGERPKNGPTTRFRP